jgi:hypothetical protein
LCAAKELRLERQREIEKLGFSGRLIHSFNPQTWYKVLTVRLGESVECAKASE